jgi:uncharacterized membrane protein
MNNLKYILLWACLNIIVIVLYEFALFYQLTPEVINRSFAYKLFFTEIFATLEWMFLIPAIHIGNKFLSVIQITLASFVFSMLGQLGANYFILNQAVELDDYIGIIIIFIGILVSTFKVIG